MTDAEKMRDAAAQACDRIAGNTADFGREIDRPLIAAAEERGRIAGLREAAEIADAHYAAGDMGNPGHHILARIPATQSDEAPK